MSDVTEKTTQVVQARLSVRSAAQKLQAAERRLSLEHAHHLDQVAELDFKARVEHTRHQKELAVIRADIAEAEVHLEREKAWLALAEANEGRGFDI